MDTNNNGGCGCGGREEPGAPDTGIVDRDLALLIAAGASMAANSQPCLRRVVAELVASGMPREQIQGAVHTGQMVKDKPAGLMKEEADELTGTRLAPGAADGPCPLEGMRSQDLDVRAPMLIAAGSAVAAGCEPCLNSLVPKLIEAGVGGADIRRAVEIGQDIKDRAATSIKEVADLLAGTNLLGGIVPEECGTEETKEGAACCV
ncbi:MAG: hypothetical protein GY723_15815 [bacterium]|nr:hypothetical protein [bacterium]